MQNLLGMLKLVRTFGAELWAIVIFIRKEFKKVLEAFDDVV